MPRPHIEFVQCQNIAWQRRADGSEVKILSQGQSSGEETLLIRYPSGYRQMGGFLLGRAKEIFILEGSMAIGGELCGLHHYRFIPRGTDPLDWHSHAGATLLIFRHGWDDANSGIDSAAPLDVAAAAMPWDISTYDPKLSHLRLARKVLRMGPNDSCRTFLLAGMPHGVPPVDALPAEYHEHCEEMFMISGSMWAPEGLLQQGAYFYRPPHIIHGPHVSEFGFFQIMRSPGTNFIKTIWSEAPSPLPIGASYQPILPEGSPEEWRRPFASSAPF